MTRFRNRLILIAAALVVILAGGTVGFVLIDNYPPFDAFYMTLVTISTVGYEEVHTLSHAGRVFNSFLIFFGVTIMLLAVGGMTQAIIELEFNQYFGKRRTRKMIDALHDHYIVCGFGRVGRGAAGELQRAGVPFLVVDKNEDRVEWAIKSGMLAVTGRRYRRRNAHGRGRAARQGPHRHVAERRRQFVRDPFGQGVETVAAGFRASRTSEQSEKKMRLAGADYVFAPYDMTGNRMAQVMLKPHVFQFIDFTTKGIGLDVGIEQVNVPPNSEFVSKTLQDARIRKDTGVIVLAIRKANGRMLVQSARRSAHRSRRSPDRDGRAADLRRLEQVLSEVRA